MIEFNRSKILGYRWILFFFLIFLAFQLYQASFFSWDPEVYLYSGKWFCGERIYFEWLRPPLPGVVNCLFGAGEFSILLSNALASFLYLAAVLLLYKKYRSSIDQLLFAAFIFIFPSIIIRSNLGSDLFALSFLLLSILIDSPIKKGIFFGLATLSRYNFFLYMPILLFEIGLKPKKLAQFLAPIVLLWIPWIIYNYNETGIPFFSVQETITLNILQKGITAPPDLISLALLGFFFVSLIFSLKDILSKKENQVAFIGTILFLMSGIKETRFLNILVPAQAINYASQATKDPKIKKILLGVVALLCIGMLVAFSGLKFSNPAVPKDEFLKECRVMSDEWINLYPAGIVSEPGIDKAAFQSYIDEGVSFVIYNPAQHDINSVSRAEVIEREKYTIVKSEKCAPQPEFFMSCTRYCYNIFAK